MKRFWLSPGVNSRLERPGVIWRFNFVRNSLRKRILRFSIVAPDSWVATDDVENTNSSGLFSFLYEVTPLKPLIHPVNDDEVFPVSEGDLILIEDGKFHQVVNDSKEPLYFVCVFDGSRNH